MMIFSDSSCPSCRPDSSCPSSHKYVYLNGRYCCRTNKEKNNIGKDGDLCDGSEIGINSRCCENNAFIKCTYGRCSNHKDAIKNDIKLHPIDSDLKKVKAV